MKNKRGYVLARSIRTGKLTIIWDRFVDRSEYEVIGTYPNYATAEAKLKSIGKPKTAKQRKQAQIDNLLDVYKFLGAANRR